MSDTTNDAPVLDPLARMTADSLAATNLDVQMLVRIAALVAIDAPPAPYALNLAPGNIVTALVAKIELGELEVAELEDDESDEGALRPQRRVGIARVVSAAPLVALALGFDLDGVIDGGLISRLTGR